MKTVTTQKSSLKRYEVPECNLFPIVLHGVLCESFPSSEIEDFDETMFNF